MEEAGREVGARPPRRAVGPARRRDRAVEAGPRLRRDREREVGALPLRRRREDVGAEGRQPADGLAAVLLLAPRRRPDEPRPDLQAEPHAHRVRGRGRELRRRGRRHARGPPRRLGQPEEPEERRDGRRRRPVDLLRRREPLVEVQQSAGLAVLPRVRRREGAVPGLRRASGQQLVGRRLRLPGRHHEQPLGEPLQQRRLLGLRRSGRPELRLRGGPGRLRRPRRPADARRARHPAEGRLPREAALQLEYAAPRLAPREGEAVHRRAVPVRHEGRRAVVAAHLARPHDERCRRSSSRKNPAASRSTTRPPRCTRRSTRSARARATRRRSGSGRTTATCSSPATAEGRGRTS